jgi:hypothetical protein
MSRWTNPWSKKTTAKANQENDALIQELQPLDNAPIRAVEIDVEAQPVRWTVEPNNCGRPSTHNGLEALMTELT